MKKELKARSSAKQSRSKEKKEKLLEVTKRLIGSKGSADVSMREIAQEAQIPIASVYHYYPNKDSILAEIMQTFFQGCTSQLDLLFNSIQKRDDLKIIVDQTVNFYFDRLKNDSTLAIIWTNIQASPALVKLDMEDTKSNAKMITQILVKKFPEFDYEETITACFSLFSYATYIARMVHMLDEEQIKVLSKEIKITIALRIQYLLDH